MKKRLLLILLVFSLVLFSGCFGSNKNEENKNENKTDVVDTEKDKEYINTISNYIGSVIFYMNEYDLINNSSSDTLLYIPVGNGFSCVDDVVESPYSDTWKYAYVVALFDGSDYSYYAVFKDGEGYGINLESRIDLISDETKTISNLGLVEAKEYVDNYKPSLGGNKIYSIDEVSSELKEVVNNNFDNVSTIVFIDSTDCSY